MDKIATVEIAVGLSLGLAAIWFVHNMLANPAQAQAVGQAAGQAVVNAGVGTVEGIGQAMGVPTTDTSKGQQDLANGDWWAASFDLPAGQFLGAAWDKLTGKTP